MLQLLKQGCSKASHLLLPLHICQDDVTQLRSTSKLMTNL